MHYRVDLPSCSDAQGAARNAASQAGFPVNQYDGILHTFPSGTSGSGGYAGGRHANVFVTPSQLWDFGAHEIAYCDLLGGGLGQASSSTNCIRASGNRVELGRSCGHDEYGDQSDFMGGATSSSAPGTWNGPVGCPKGAAWTFRDPPG